MKLFSQYFIISILLFWIGVGPLHKIEIRVYLGQHQQAQTGKTSFSFVYAPCFKIYIMVAMLCYVLIWR